MIEICYHVIIFKFLPHTNIRLRKNANKGPVKNAMIMVPTPGMFPIKNPKPTQIKSVPILTQRYIF
jgi:hypothetical protein